jgi:hypothetical protein
MLIERLSCKTVRVNLLIRDGDDMERVPSVTRIGKLFKISFQSHRLKLISIYVSVLI